MKEEKSENYSGWNRICLLYTSKGSITVNGEVAPLIELGAGFDPNLPARENIYLNGTVLGHRCV